MCACWFSYLKCVYVCISCVCICVCSVLQYKESLLGAAAHGDLGNTDDPRRIIVTEFRVVFEDELTVR